MSMDPKQQDPRRDRNQKPGDPGGSRFRRTLLIVGIVLSAVVLFNMFYSTYVGAYLKPVAYSEFMDKLTAGEIVEAEFEGDRIEYLTKEEKAKPESQQVVYYTGLIPYLDTNELVTLLDAQGVLYNNPVEPESTPLEAVLEWLWPTLLMFVLFFKPIQSFLGLEKRTVN